MPVILLYGDNHLDIEEAAARVRQPFSQADTLFFDGATTPLPSIAEACVTAGLFDPQRLIVVRDLQDRYKGARKDNPDREHIRSILAGVVPTTTVLLTAPDLAADHQLVKDVTQYGGTARSFVTPRKQDLPRWVAGRGKRLEVRVDTDAAELLVELVGANPIGLETELEKLATYSGDEKHITAPMVEQLVGAVPQDSIFALVDAVAAGDRARALQLLHTQLASASTTGIDFALYLIRMLARQIRILLRIQLGQQAGRSTSQISSDLKIPRYYADRYFRQARRLSSERLRDAFEQLAALEHGLKSGKTDAPTGLDLLVTELCS